MATAGIKRNILFITADQFRADCLSASGHPVVRTPNLDALAAEGTRFTDNYANCVPCAPSRTSLHTGLYQATHRVLINGNPLDARFTTWANELRSAGRDPVLFGYTDTALDPRTLPPDDPGLTTYEGCLPGLRHIADCNDEHQTMEDWVNWLAVKGYDLPEHRKLLRQQTIPSRQADKPRPLKLPAELSDTAFIVEQARDYIDHCGEDEWTIHLSLFRPHTPHIAPAPYNEMYDIGALPTCVRAKTPAEEAAAHPFLSWALEWYPCESDDLEQRKLQASYYGLISEVDHHLGHLFQHLKSTGHWENTLIVFTSDHGDQMGDHHMKAKSGFFDQSYRTPLLIRDPRPEADAHRGATLDGFTEAIDIFPTLLDYAGLRAPSQCDGFSLLPAVHTGAMPSHWREESFFEYTFWPDTDMITEHKLEEKMAREFGLAPHQCSLCVVRSKEYKYVHFAGHNLPPLLFDVRSDAAELNNLAGDPQYAPIVAAMAGRMLSRRLTHADRSLSEIVVTRSGPIQRSLPLRISTGKPGHMGMGEETATLEGEMGRMNGDFAASAMAMGAYAHGFGSSLGSGSSTVGSGSSSGSSHSESGLTYTPSLTIIKSAQQNEPRFVEHEPRFVDHDQPMSRGTKRSIAETLA